MGIGSRNTSQSVSCHARRVAHSVENNRSSLVFLGSVALRVAWIMSVLAWCFWGSVARSVAHRIARRVARRVKNYRRSIVFLGSVARRVARRVARCVENYRRSFLFLGSVARRVARRIARRVARCVEPTEWSVADAVRR